MDKVNPHFRLSTVEGRCKNDVFGAASCDSDAEIVDERVSRLLVLLQRIDDFVEGLDELPEPELTEIVSSAIRVSGYVDPVEVRQVIATVLDAIGTRDRIPIPKQTASAAQEMS